MAFLSVGIDHEHAPLELLERITLPEERWASVLGHLSQLDNVHEAVVVSTCLRTEVYAVIDRFHGAVDDISAALAHFAQLDPQSLANQMTIHFDRGVPRTCFPWRRDFAPRCPVNSKCSDNCDEPSTWRAMSASRAPSSMTFFIVPWQPVERCALTLRLPEAPPVSRKRRWNWPRGRWAASPVDASWWLGRGNSRSASFAVCSMQRSRRWSS